jgi:phage host-nuclease inhibitor protein Gam
MDPYKAGQPAPVEVAAPAALRMAPAPVAAVEGAPALPPDVPQYFLPVRGSAAAGSTLTYQPMVLGAAKVNFIDAKTRLDFTQDTVCLTPLTDQPIPVDWEAAQETDVSVSDLEKAPQEGGQFAELPAAASKAKNYAAWEKDLVTWVYGSQKLDLFKSPSLGELSQPGETERDFRVRLQQAARESRDAAAEKLRAKYAPKIATLKERVRRAEQVVEREAEQAKAQKVQTAISFGSTVLGAFVGRRAVSGTLGRATTAARGVSRSMKEQQDVGRAEETVSAIQQQLADLETEFTSEMGLLEAKVDPQAETLEQMSIRPKKTNIAVQLLALAWAPYWQAKDGSATQAY